MSEQFKKALHKAMSANSVDYYVLAYLLGYRWSHWLISPSWDKEIGWLTPTRHPDDPGYPDTAEKQAKVLDIVNNAHSNVNYWKFKYQRAKSSAWVFGHGVTNLQKRMDENSKYWNPYIRWSILYRLERMKSFMSFKWLMLKFRAKNFFKSKST